jgi:hypothetical protein
LPRRAQIPQADVVHDALVFVHGEETSLFEANCECAMTDCSAPVSERKIERSAFRAGLAAHVLDGERRNAPSAKRVA